MVKPEHFGNFYAAELVWICCKFVATVMLQRCFLVAPYVSHAGYIAIYFQNNFLLLMGICCTHN